VRWLVIGDVTAAATDALRRFGHDAVTPESIGLPGDANAAVIFAAATKAQVDVLTADAGLARTALDGTAPFGRAIALLAVGPGDVEQDDAIDRLFARYKRPGLRRLYTVTASRVKVRQLPGAQKTPREKAPASKDSLFRE
jgi:hypothetical protein